jgi:crotonobetainyl-CoA:carnitine CoA-transferase CaiB-like acyl-CoA transferase
MVYEMQIAQTGEAPRRSVYGPMPTRDGFVSVAPVSQKQFRALMTVIDRTDWIEDPRWSSVESREENWGELMESVAAWTSARDTEECLKLLSDAAVAVAPYRTPTEVLADEQLAHRETFATFSDAGGDYQLINPPFRFADGSVRARGRPPLLGGDRSSILSDWLGGTT